MNAPQVASVGSHRELPVDAAHHAGNFLIPCKPGIAFAAAIAGFTGMVAAGQCLPDPFIACICLLALVTAAAGAALVNSLVEANSDSRMGRLGRRSSALARLGRRNGWCLALGLIIAAVGLAAMGINLLTAVLLLAAVLHYAVVYTLWLKRRSPFAPITGGVAGALPVLIGAAAVNSVGPAPLILFLFLFLWQPPHFWVLALRYREEYRDAGFPVLPQVYGEPYTRSAILLSIATLLPTTLSLWLAGFCSGWYGAIATALWLAYLILTVAALNTRRHRQAFTLSLCYLNLVFLAVILDFSLLRGM